MSTRATLSISLRALQRNRLQTVLTITGMTIGVAAVLTMIAIGSGAETAIEDQIRAAGMNLIVVTAGNYKVKSTDDFGGGAVEPADRFGIGRGQRGGRSQPGFAVAKPLLRRRMVVLLHRVVFGVEGDADYGVRPLFPGNEGKGA